MRASCGHVLLHHPSLPIPIAATPTCGFPAPLIPHPDVVFSHNHTLTHLQFSAPLICVTSNKSKIYKSHWQEASHMMMLVVSLLAQQLFKETCQRKSEHKPPCRFKQNFEDTNWDDNQTKWMRTKSPTPLEEFATTFTSAAPSTPHRDHGHHSSGGLAPFYPPWVKYLTSGWKAKWHPPLLSQALESLGVRLYTKANHSHGLPAVVAAMHVMSSKWQG